MEFLLKLSQPLEHFSFWAIAAVIIFVSAFAFGLWFYIRLQKVSAPDFHLAQARQQAVGPFNIHYVQEGHGPHLLLLHGLGATTYCWRFIFEELTKNFTVTVVDLPGFGQSSKLIQEDYGLDLQTDRMIEFCDELGIEQCRIVGCSMGGTIALWMSKKFPQRFFEVALLAPATNPKRVPVALKKLGWTSGVLRFGVNRQLIKLIMGRVYERTSLINDESIDQALMTYQDPKAVKTFIKATELIRDPRLPLELSPITSRKLLLYGQKDQIIPPFYMDDLEKILTNVVRADHSEAGHHVMEDEPEWTVQQLEIFFGSDEV